MTIRKGSPEGKTPGLLCQAPVCAGLEMSTGSLMSVILAMASVVVACQPEATPTNRPDPREVATAMTPEDAPPLAQKVRLRGGSRLGVPLHPMPRTRGISGRIPAGTEVRILAERYQGHWLKVRAPGGETGWITRTYVDWRRAPGDLISPPHGGEKEVVCPLPPPRPSPRLRAGEAQVVRRGPERDQPLPKRLVVASYNVWELYDGVGPDRYLSRDHAAPLTPENVQRRVAMLAAQLRPERPHIIALQEIEHAELACSLAHQVVPDGNWVCGAGRFSSSANPQNVAVASRIGGSIQVLRPQGRFAPRGVVKLAALGGRLKLLAVHLKSSRGARGLHDCRNAQRREAMVEAIAGHLEPTRASVAALVAGDFNVDPRQSPHDRTESRLLAAGLKCLRTVFYPKGAPSTYPAYRSTIDLAFFRPGAGIRATGFRVLTGARTDQWVSDHRPVVVTLEIQ